MYLAMDYSKGGVEDLPARLMWCQRIAGGGIIFKVIDIPRSSNYFKYSASAETTLKSVSKFHGSPES